MKLTGDLKCPKCGDEIMGAVDMIPGVALITLDADRSFEYAGGTNVFWDGQINRIAYDDADAALRLIREARTVEEARNIAAAALVPDGGGRMVVQCHDGHEWVVSVEEEPADYQAQPEPTDAQRAEAMAERAEALGDDAKAGL